MINIIIFEERKIIIKKLLKYLKNELLDNEQKEIIYEIVMNLKKGSKQKNRFNMFYGLYPNGMERSSILKIASYYKCRKETIRESIYNIEGALYHITEKEILQIKKVLEDIDGI